MKNIKHISLNVTDEIKKILPVTLEKDLQDDEIICPVCHGFGILKQDYRFGVKEDDTEKAFKLNWYDNEYLTLCPNCYFGRIKTCKYCGKPLQKQTNRCSCDGYRKQEAEEKRIRYQETINKAKEVDVDSVTTYLYDEQTDHYFSEIEDFVNEYKDSTEFENDEEMIANLPEVLWVCTKEEITMDAGQIIEDACEELHEDARDCISNKDEKQLQEFLDKWCEKQSEKQSETTTYYPCYKEYVKVQKEWFD